MQVFFSLTAVGTGELKARVSWAQQMKDGAHPSPSAVLFFPGSKRDPLTAGMTERGFQSSDGEAQSRSRYLPAIFCSITERL